jgi:hypothetical protein
MKTVKSFTVRIWIAGDYMDAVRAVREFCEEGACFAVAPCDYAYTGGMEAGVCVTRINYPRFPADPSAIVAQCLRLGEHLRARLFQDSFAVETPEETHWITRRVSE